mgnify:CR=1 FL=1
MKGLANVLPIIVISLCLAICNVAIFAADKSCDSDEKIIDAGKIKAKELGVNPIPVCTDAEDHLVIVGGAFFTMQNNKFVLSNSDMLINSGTKVIKPQGITLSKGEYAIVKNNKLIKGRDILLPKQK